MKTSTAVAMLLAVLAASAGAPACADDDSIRVTGGEKRTVGDYAWAAGKVCFSIKRDDGSPGTVKMWLNGLSDVHRRSYVGNACFQVLGFARIRASDAADGPVTIRVIRDTVASVPFLGHVR